LKILLIRPKQHKDSLGLTDLMHCEPLDLEYVGTALKQEGHEVVLIDMVMEKRGLEFFLRKYNPEIVMFTSYQIHVNVVKGYSDIVKEFNERIITAVGGIHSEVCPEDFEYKHIDYIMGINGIENAVILLDALQKEIEVKFKNDKINTEFQLPKVDRTLTDKYRKRYYYSYRESTALLKTSFGCPYDCKFCFSVAATNYQYFERDMDIVIEEIKEIREKNIFVADDNFLVDRHRIQTFCELLDKNGIKKMFSISARADFICANEDIIKLLSEHGVDTIFIGMESFKQEDLNNFGKRTEVELSVKASDICRKYNIQLQCSAIVGYDWDKNDFKEFAVWIKKNLYFRYINFMPLAPLIGTKIGHDYDDRLLIPREEYEKWEFQHIIIKPSKIKTSEFYVEMIKIFFKVTGKPRNLIFLYNTCGFRTCCYTIKGFLKLFWNWYKLILQYRKIGD